MKTMKFVFFSFALSLFALTGCLEDTGNNQNIPDDVAVVRYTSEYPGETFLDTPYGSVMAPDLNGKNYKTGDCLITSFYIDYDNQPAQAEYYVVSDVKEKKIGKTNIIMLNVQSQDVNEEIETMSADSIYGVGLIGNTAVSCIDNNLFMGFVQMDTETQNYDYQLVYSDTFIDDIPVLYVCAKKSSVASATPYGNYRVQAIDITPFLNLYSTSENQITFYLKYKSGVDKDGKNVYKLISDQAVTLTNYYVLNN